MLSQFPVNELAFCQSAESRLYAGFAQNYLMTYFPAAYPRWFLQGFGEMFATMKAGDDFVEYGHLPPGFWQVMEHYSTAAIRSPTSWTAAIFPGGGPGRHTTPGGWSTFCISRTSGSRGCTIT